MTELAPGALLTRLRFRQLRLVEVLERTRNLRRAASEMNMTQPAATKILKDLEDTLGTRLFDRTSRGMAPTEIGAHVVEYARRTLSEGERFSDALSNLRRGGYGALAVGAIMAIASDLLPRAIAELKRRRPLMMVRVLASTSDELVAALDRGELDLAIGRVPEPRDRARFDLEPLAREELWVFAAASHPYAASEHLDLAEVAAMPCVLQPAPSPMRLIIEAALAAEGHGPPENVVETTSIFATLSLVRHAGMISVLPSTIVAQAVESGDFARLPVTIGNDLAPYGILTRKDTEPTPNAAEFISIVRALAPPPFSCSET
ncbi:LysR family transcriptional regulator [Amaricoccus sp. W119]|uniref:LysR family transcriptional regulator n=1 Tax=Amaricoccus sp. W119 TaxID=3391833 RepID=UPI0039A7632A